MHHSFPRHSTSLATLALAFLESALMGALRMTHCRPAAWFACLLLFGGAGYSSAAAGDVAAKALGEPVLGVPTLHSIGVHWVVGGDTNENCVVHLAWRANGSGEWNDAGTLWRVEKGAHQPPKGGGSVQVPDGATLFAGSALQLYAATSYELKLNLVDTDGGDQETVIKTQTIGEPADPRDATIFHVAPGNGGGSGTAADPFKGLAAAQAQARPGVIFRLHAGIYPAPFDVRHSGEPERPIVWRAAGDGEVVIEGTADGKEGRLISADDRHDVWFEGLTIRNGDKAIAGRGSARIVVRRCHMQGVTYGIFATRNDKDQMRSWFVSDNVIEGPSTWPRTKGIETARGVQLTGAGHVICHNRIKGFGDAVDTFPSVRCTDIDIHNNDISEMTDDGIELDFSERNIRCFSNRLTNVFQGISVQPIFGGPVYVFRNAVYNVVAEPFKMHNSPSGALFYHNTIVKKGMPFLVQTSAAVRYCRTRNNLFIGAGGPFAFESTAKMVNCDFDYDGVGGGAEKLFLKWNNVRYATVEEVRAKAPVWRHVVSVDPSTAFATQAAPPADEKAIQVAADLRLKPGTPAIDAGERIPGVNGNFTGTAPDLGAYELNAALPIYGPRPIKN
jgi:hypothetical protein